MKGQPLLQLANRRAMGFLPNEMKMDLRLDLMGPDFDSICGSLPSGVLVGSIMLDLGSCWRSNCDYRWVVVLAWLGPAAGEVRPLTRCFEDCCPMSCARYQSEDIALSRHRWCAWLLELVRGRPCPAR
ncbi:hypothetical protein ACLOJK_014747 [Asimina triloba]